MKLYVYIFKRLDLKRFEIFKNIPSNCRPQFQIFLKDIGYITTIFLYYGYIFLKDIGYITTSTNSHIKCIVCICVSFLYICLTSETLHYPWIPS